MRCDGLYLDGIGLYLPRRVDAADAVSAGWYDAPARERTGQVSVAVAEEPGPELAIRAANSAIDRSGHDTADVSLLLYATSGYPGIEYTNIAAYVQNRTIGGQRVVAAEIRQASNGGMAMLELAAGFLGARGRGAALLATGDRFALPAFNRWRADPGMVWGDAGTAVVLSRRDGFAQLRSLFSTSDATLEGLHRGDTPFEAAPSLDDLPVDIPRRKQEFFDRVPVAEVERRIRAGFLAAVDGASAAAGVAVDKVARVVLANLGREVIQARCLEPLGLDLSRTVFDWGRTIGHLGPGDQVAGLHHLVTSGQVQPGDHVLLIGMGGGFAWTCAVVEVLRLPEWAIPRTDRMR